MDASDPNLPVVALVVLFLATNVALVAGVTTSGTTLGPYNDDWNGGTALVSTADATSDAEVTRSTGSYPAETAPSTVGFSLSPERPYRGTDAARLQRFLSNGGTLVVAGEGGGEAARLLRRLGAETRFEGTPLRDERFNDGNGHLPRTPNVSAHPLVADVDRLTLSRGTALEIPGAMPAGDERRAAGSPRNDDVEVLVRSSQFAYLDANENETLDRSERVGGYPVAAVESIGAGRLVVVSDTTLFTNAMLERDGNRAFVRALAGAGDHAVLDYSHSPAFPPLTYLLVRIRASPLLQAAVGAVGLAAIGLWLSRSPSAALERAIEGVSADRPSADGATVGVDLDPTDLAAAVRERHPDWDEDRVERVTQTIIRQRRE